MIAPAIGATLGGLLGQFGDAASWLRRKTWSSLGLPESGSQLISNLTGMDVDSPLVQALGFGAEFLGDPLTIAGGVLGAGGKLWGAGGRIASRIMPEITGTSGAGARMTTVPTGRMGNLLSLRRQYDALKDVATTEGGGLTGRLVRGGAKDLPIDDALMQQRLSAMRPYARASGLSNPDLDVIYQTTSSRVPWETVRHENVHQMIAKAAQQGAAADLPSILMRVPARLYSGAQPGSLRQGVGAIADELAARTLGPISATPMRQLAEGAKFLFSADPSYYRHFSSINPYAGLIYKSIPYITAGTAAGLPLGAGALYQHLSD